MGTSRATAQMSLDSVKLTVNIIYQVSKIQTPQVLEVLLVFSAHALSHPVARHWWDLRGFS